MGNLPATKDDIDRARRTLQFYGATEENEYNCEDPTAKEMLQLKNKLYKRFKSKPKKKYLVYFILAGHGMNVGGQQVLLLNEYDPKSKYYKMWNIEKILRAFA